MGEKLIKCTMVYGPWTTPKFFWLKKQTQLFSHSNDDHETYKTYQETSLMGRRLNVCV